MKNLITRIKQKFITNLNALLYFSAFVKVTLTEMGLFFYKKQVGFIVLLRQILFTGFEALNIISLIGLSIGGIIIIQGNLLLNNFGQSKLVYAILIIIITKELGPIITAFVIVARSGTAITTELGNMVVNHEMEALTSIGINPISYLVIPRILGVVISLFALTIYFNIAGLIGGFLVANLVQPLSFFDFFLNLLEQLKISDIIIGMSKSIIFGIIISIISCYQGFSVKFASTEVPQRTIKSVVQSFSGIIIFDAIITLIVYS